MSDPDVVGAFNTKHQPSRHAMDKLDLIAGYGADGMPAQEVNFTVRDKLLAFGYVTMRDAPSAGWYSTHKATDTRPFLYITVEGYTALKGQTHG